MHADDADRAGAARARDDDAIGLRGDRVGGRERMRRDEGPDRFLRAQRADLVGQLETARDLPTEAVDLERDAAHHRALGRGGELRRDPLIGLVPGEGFADVAAAMDQRAGDRDHRDAVDAAERRAPAGADLVLEALVEHRGNRARARLFRGLRALDRDGPAEQAGAQAGDEGRGLRRRSHQRRVKHTLRNLRIIHDVSPRGSSAARHYGRAAWRNFPASGAACRQAWRRSRL